MEKTYNCAQKIHELTNNGWNVTFKEKMKKRPDKALGKVACPALRCKVENKDKISVKSKWIFIDNYDTALLQSILSVYEKVKTHLRPITKEKKKKKK